jgi:hypothetical protein
MNNSGLTVFNSGSGKFGFRNRNGEVIIEPVYDRVENFAEGLAAVNIGYEEAYDDRGSGSYCVNRGKWGFINEKGEVVIPLTYHSVTLFSEGLAAVDNRSYIDKTGKVVITLTKHYDEIFPFVEGFATVMRNNQYGYIDRSGKEVVPPVHPKAIIARAPVDLLIGQNLLKLSLFESSGKWGYKNVNGDMVIPAIYTVACVFSMNLH